VVRPPAGLDRNKNRISDLLEVDLGIYAPVPPGVQIQAVPRLPAPGGLDTEIEVLISLSRPPDASDEDAVLRAGTLLGSWRQLAYVLAARMTAAEVIGLAGRSEDIVWVERSPRAKTALLRANEHVRARKIWSGTAGLPGTYTGSGLTVAVLDTGLDQSHPDFSGKVFSWLDLVGSLSSPDDRNGHGTHIAGIIAGSGNAARENAYPVSLPSYFPDEYETGWIEPVPVRASAPQSLAARLWAEDSGKFYFILENEQGTTRFLNEEIVGNGNDEVTYLVEDEGTYLAIFAHDRSPESFYVGRVLVPFDGYGDGYPLTAGIAPGARLGIYRILDDQGEGGSAEFLTALEDVSRRAISRSIIAANASLTFDSAADSIDTAVNNLVEEGVVFAAAAGNERDLEITIGSPGTASLALAVGAMTLDDELAEYSSAGGSREPMKPDLLAPGGAGIQLSYIFSADTNRSDSADREDEVLEFFSDRFPDDYVGKIGTSQAAAFVSGAAALLAEAREGWSFGSADDPKWVKMLLCMTASEIFRGELPSHVPTLGRDDEPKDKREGYGRMNLDAALEAAILVYTVGTEARDVLEPGLGAKRAWARSVELQQALEYRFELDNPSTADFDLYLYRGAPDENGEPVIVAASTRSGRDDETIDDFVPDADGTHYLVVKRVDGWGEFSLKSSQRNAPLDGEDEGCGCRIVPGGEGTAGSPAGVLAGMLFLLLPILVFRMMRIKTSLK